jgi:cell division septation protein DedD
MTDQTTTPPQDSLRRMANTLNAAQERGGSMVDAGRAGGYQLQVSSFKSLPDATAFASALRRRGHRAHVQSAQVKGRGLWHRVRVGPFKYKRSASIYRQDFEAKERLVSFVVNPPTTRVRIGLSED